MAVRLLWPVTAGTVAVGAFAVAPPHIFSDAFWTALPPTVVAALGWLASYRNGHQIQDIRVTLNGTTTEMQRKHTENLAQLQRAHDDLAAAAEEILRLRESITRMHASIAFLETVIKSVEVKADRVTVTAPPAGVTPGEGPHP